MACPAPYKYVDPLAWQGRAFGSPETTAGIENIPWGAPALWSAASHGQTSEVLKLLKDGADVEERGGPTFTTPLFVASCQGHEGVVHALLEHSADASAADFYGWTPLHRAANRGREAVVVLLVEHGADLSAENDGGETPLLCAACWGHENIVKLLLDKMGWTQRDLELWIMNNDGQ